MEQLPRDIAQKLENLPIVSFNNANELQSVIMSQDFLDILTYYEEHYMPDAFKKLQEIQKRIALYLTLTNQDTNLTEQIDSLLYRRPMPTIEEFLTGKFYMYNSNATLYPYWRKQLEYMFREGSPVRKTIFGGSIGVGKSTIARKAFLYVLYRILCLRYPRAVFNIDSDATIANVIISMTLKQVYETNLLPFVKLMETMPCFQRVMRMQSFENFDLSDPHCPIPFNVEKSSGTIYFPDNIILTSGSGITHTIGLNIVNSFCFTGAMKVYTDKGIITFMSLHRQFKDGIKFNTYSINSQGIKEKTEITDVKITGYKQDFIRIYYDDTRYIECTPEHPFVILNPKNNDQKVIYENGIPYKQAQYLTEDDEIYSENNAYVYALIDNRPYSNNYDKPFYIGISSHDNQLASLDNQKYARPYYHFTNKCIKTCNNPLKNAVILDILSHNFKPEVKILKENISLEDAFDLEKALIRQFGKKCDNDGILTNISDGGEGTVLTTIEIIKKKSKKIKETKQKIREEKLNKQRLYYQKLFSDLKFMFALIIVCNIHSLEVKNNRKKAASRPDKINLSRINIIKYNKSEEHRKKTAYYNSVRPKVSSPESKAKLAKSQRETWNKKSEIEKTKDNLSKSLGRAWNVLRRVDGIYINEQIFNAHRSKGSRLANTEPLWKSIIRKTNGIENFLSLIKERYGKEFVYEN